jgi:hypothetical protein
MVSAETTDIRAARARSAGVGLATSQTWRIWELPSSSTELGMV